ASQPRIPPSSRTTIAPVLPLSDHNPSRTTPVVNIILIAANVFFFFWELSLGPNLEPALFNVAFIPARFWISPLHPVNVIGIFVSMFLHGGWLHLGGNMLYLWIFGDNIEDRLGHFRYLIFYLLCGIVAALAHAFFNPGSRMPRSEERRVGEGCRYRGSG